MVVFLCREERRVEYPMVNIPWDGYGMVILICVCISLVGEILYSFQVIIEDDV